MVTRKSLPKNQWLSLDEVKASLGDSDAAIRQYQWLSEYGSMTSRLIEAATSPLEVQVLSSKEMQLAPEEQSFLNLGNQKQSYVREVIMSIDNSPWLFGRTVIPDATLKGEGEQLKQLGSKPLGQLLFSNQLNSRQFVEVAVITEQHFLYPESTSDDQKNNLWARRSLFLFNDSPLMVQEVFLPACPLLMPA